MSDRKALNIGINQFRDYPEFALRGCVNDVKNFNKVLIEDLGFSEGDMVELVDEQATKANIINTLKSIVADATQGNYSCIFLKLSMHGTQISNKTGIEVDHMDEAFVPYDVAQIDDNWDREHIIVDDELAEILSTLPSNVLFEGFADTCHSGTEIRMIELFRTTTLAREKAPSIINRYVEPIRRSESHSTTVLKEQGLQRHGIRDALAGYEMRNYVWWSGCRDNQTAADAYIEQGGGWHGAFTYYLCDEIRKSGNRKTRSTLIDSVTGALTCRYIQVPQLHSRPEYHQLPIGSMNRAASTPILV